MSKLIKSSPYAELNMNLNKRMDNMFSGINNSVMGAEGLLTNKVNKSGDTMTGNLIINPPSGDRGLFISNEKHGIYKPTGSESGNDICIRTARADSNAPSGHIRFLNGTSGSVTEKMRIDNVGNVGIGTNTPTSKLHVKNGNITVQNSSPILVLKTDNDKRGKIVFGNSNHYIERDDSNNLKVRTANGSNTANQGDISFITGTSSGGTEKMRITHGGNVGIGTATPTSKLHVNGAIRADNLSTNTILTTDVNKNIVSSGLSSDLRIKSGRIKVRSTYNTDLTFNFTGFTETPAIIYSIVKSTTNNFNCVLNSVSGTQTVTVVLTAIGDLVNPLEECWINWTAIQPAPILDLT